MTSRDIHELLISAKIRIPTGLLNWCLEFELSDSQILTALTFAINCNATVFDRVFQYKIITNILPTNDYLKRYRIKDDDTCENCHKECDTIIHRLYDCELIGLHIEKILNFLKLECNKMYDISMIEFLFGKSGEQFLALNHAVLELKKLVFYASKEFLSSADFPEFYYAKIKALIIKDIVLDYS